MAVNQFEIGRQNKAAKTQSLVQEKKQPKKVASAMDGMSLTSMAPLTGPKSLDGSRDAWANALDTMSGVRTPDPLTAIAKVAGMGLAGYGQGKATREKEAGSAAYRAKLAEALSGTPDNATLMQLYNDPYADEGSQRMAWNMYERNNPTQDQIQQRELRDLQMQQTQQGMEQGAASFQQQQELYAQQQAEIQRQNALRGGRMDAVEGFTQNFEEQGGDLFDPGMQQMLRQQGIAGVDPADTRRYDAMQPYVDAGDYDTAFQQMTQGSDPTKGIAVNGNIVNPITGQVIYEGPPEGQKPTDNMREWQQSNADRAAQGIPPERFDEYQIRMKKAGATTIPIDMKGETKFAEEAGKALVEPLKAYAAGAAQATEMLGNVGMLREMAAGFNTGKGAELMAAFGPWAKSLGIEVEGLSEMQAYQAIISRMLPNMRTPGSGTTSDFDAQQFMLSLPQLGNTEEGNAVIENTLEAVAQWKIAAADIANQALRQEISPAEADAAIRALGDPWSLFKASREQLLPPESPGLPRVRKYNPKTGKIE
jgi:hypothetical protein